MHVVGEVQRQPSKKRHVTEKLIGALYDIGIVIKYVTFLIIVATTTIAANRTFGDGFWSPSGYLLSPILTYKLQGCEYHVVRSIYAFHNVSVTITGHNVAELMTDFGGQLRTLIVLSGIALFLGAVNREIFRHNRFFIRWRHMYFHKDVITTVEVLLLALIFYTTFHLADQQSLLTDALHGCGVKRSAYLPFVSLTPMYVFIAAAATSFVIATCVLVYNACGENVQQTRGGMISHEHSGPMDPTSTAMPSTQADLHEEPDGIDSETEDGGSEAARYHHHRHHPSHNVQQLSTTDQPTLFQTHTEEMQFASASQSTPTMTYSYRSPTRMRAGGNVRELGATASAGGASHRSSFLQHRPAPLQYMSTNRLTGNNARPGGSLATTPLSTAQRRAVAGSVPVAAPPTTQPRHLPPPVSNNVGSVPPPPPPHQSFYLFQQPGQHGVEA
jgi:hypothetical protein